MKAAAPPKEAKPRLGLLPKNIKTVSFAARMMTASLSAACVHRKTRRGHSAKMRAPLAITRCAHLPTLMDHDTFLHAARDQRIHRSTAVGPGSYRRFEKQASMVFAVVHGSTMRNDVAGV